MGLGQENWFQIGTNSFLNQEADGSGIIIVIIEPFLLSARSLAFQ